MWVGEATLENNMEVPQKTKKNRTSMCMGAQSLSLVWLFADPMSPPSSSVHRIFQARMLENEHESCLVMPDFLQIHGLYSLWNYPSQNTGVGWLSLLQGIFQTQELNPGLPHCRQILYQMSHKGSPRILGWVAIPSPAGLPNPGIELGSPWRNN